MPLANFAMPNVLHFVPLRPGILFSAILALPMAFFGGAGIVEAQDTPGEAQGTLGFGSVVKSFFLSPASNPLSDPEVSDRLSRLVESARATGLAGAADGVGTGTCTEANSGGEGGPPQMDSAEVKEAGSVGIADQVAKAEKMFRDGRSQEALDSLVKILKQKPGHAGALLLMSKVLAGQEGNREALTKSLAILRQLGKRFPEASEKWFSVRECEIAVLARLGRRGDAEKSAALLLAVYPDCEGGGAGRERKARIGKSLGTGR